MQPDTAGDPVGRVHVVGWYSKSTSASLTVVIFLKPRSATMRSLTLAGRWRGAGARVRSVRRTRASYRAGGALFPHRTIVAVAS